MHKLAITIALGLLSGGAAMAGEQIAEVEVSGLWCPSCSFIVGEALQESASLEILEFIPGETSETGVYIVTFDDTLTNLDEIVGGPAQYGYTAQVLTVAARGS